MPRRVVVSFTFNCRLQGNDQSREGVGYIGSGPAGVGRQCASFASVFFGVDFIFGSIAVMLATDCTRNTSML
jgi:hypothetical protein